MQAAAKYVLVFFFASWSAVASAGLITFDFTFESSDLLAPADWSDASGSVTFDDVGTGSFLLSSLTDLSIQFEAFGELFTLADAATPLTEVVAIITTTGPSSKRLSFSNTASSGSGPLAGSFDLVNSGGAALGFSPPFFSDGFVLSAPFVGSPDAAIGRYRADSRAVPVSSSLILCLLGIFLLLIQGRLRSVPAVVFKLPHSR